MADHRIDMVVTGVSPQGCLDLPSYLRDFDWSSMTSSWPTATTFVTDWTAGPAADVDTVANDLADLEYIKVAEACLGTAPLRWSIWVLPPDLVRQMRSREHRRRPMWIQMWAPSCYGGKGAPTAHAPMRTTTWRSSAHDSAQDTISMSCTCRARANSTRVTCAPMHPTGTFAQHCFCSGALLTVHVIHQVRGS